MKMYLFRYNGQLFLCPGHTTRGAQLNLDRIFGWGIVRIERLATVKEKLALHGRVIPHTSPIDKSLERHVAFALRIGFLNSWMSETEKVIATILDPTLPAKTKDFEGRMDAVAHQMYELPMWDEED